jgi:hypothetical protein
MSFPFIATLALAWPSYLSQPWGIAAAKVIHSIYRNSRPGLAFLPISALGYYGCKSLFPYYQSVFLLHSLNYANIL